MIIHEDTVLDGHLCDILELHRGVDGHSPKCEIKPPASIAGYVLACDHSTVNVDGGHIRLELVGTDESLVNLAGGRVGGLNASLHAVVRFSGGRVEEEMFVSYGGTLHWSGGTVGGPLKVASPTATVHVYGSSLSFGPANTIWGTLRDGSEVGPQFFDLLLGAERHQIILHGENEDTGDEPCCKAWSNEDLRDQMEIPNAFGTGLTLS